MWKCEKCGEGEMIIDESIVLTSYPPKYKYVCNKCGHIECDTRNYLSFGPNEKGDDMLSGLACVRKVVCDGYFS